MSELRNSFVATFGEDDARAIENAASVHRSGLSHGDDQGDDEFADAFSVCIGFDCLTTYRDDHGIVADTAALRAWCLSSRCLDRVIGPIDFLAVFAGAYDSWLPPELLESDS